jgi:hypothetical protein
VLTFHGVDGIGWEAIPHERHKAYFSYMKEKENDLWVATFKDATKYMRERMNAKVDVDKSGDDKITVRVNHSLDTTLYNFPLTLKTYVDKDWKKVTVKQGDQTQNINITSDENGNYAVYQVMPNGGQAELSGVE